MLINNNICRKFAYILASTLFILDPSRTNSQVTPDNTINTQVDIKDNIAEITGGEVRGGNLFHSFQDFSLLNGHEAFFNNAINISNIFSRVTGGNISHIDGLIKANGSANLFLVNPAGILFTENARLDIGGSFMATTAEKIEFENGEFSASIPRQPSLTINLPIGLGFGSNPGDITIQGRQNNVVVEIPSFKVNTDNLPPGINVNPGKNISLMGGNIDFDGGGIKAPGGNIELASTSGSETISLLPVNDWFHADFDDILQFTDISLSNAAYIDVSSEVAGNINISGRQITVDEGSVILANTSLSSDHAVNITASEAIKILGTSGQFNADKSFNEIEQIIDNNLSRDEIKNNYSISLIGADIFSDSHGTGNHININTKNLQIFDAGQIRTVNFSNGKSTAGDTNINAENILVRGTNNIDSLLTSLITTSTSPGSVGNGGNVNIFTQSLQVEDGGRIKADSFGLGSGGNLTIESQELLLKGFVKPFVPIFAGLFASSPIDDSSGNISIQTRTLNVLDGAKISSNTFGKSSAGKIDIEADLINVSGSIPFGNFFPSSITASVNLGGDPSNVAGIVQANPEAGRIDIDTNELQVFDGARIEAVNNVGNSGSINISAQNIELNGTRPQVRDFIGGISTSTRPSSLGDGGDITINTNSLKIFNGAIIRAISLGSGDAGNITINAETTEISGVDRFAPEPISPLRVSKINTGALKSNGGNISINSSSIKVRDFGEISASTASGKGLGGNIFLNAQNITLQNQSNITAGAFQGNGGNIKINTDTILGLEDSDIRANAFQGNGGNIKITADYLLGFETRSQTTLDSDITASSEFGLNGNITINTPDTLANEEVIIATKKFDFYSQEKLLSQSCLQSNRPEKAGSLIVLSQNGLSESSGTFLDEPEFLLPSPPGQQFSSSTQDHSPTPVWDRRKPLIEANAVQITPDGRTLLVAKIKMAELQEQICHRYQR